MTSNISTNIKQRETPNDVFITPLGLAKKQIDMIEHEPDEIWYDPFKNDGSYYNQYPNDNKEWSEILHGRDFFEFDGRVDIICSNPPYSCIDKVLHKCIELNPRVISLLIGQGNLTAKRIEHLEQHGYGLKKIHMCKVFKWYGMSYIVQFERGQSSIMTYDRTVWR
jgi:hypothetical protein